GPPYGQLLAVRRERQRIHPFAAILQLTDQAAGGKVPQPERVFLNRAGREVTAVRGESQRERPGGPHFLQPATLVAALDLPQENRQGRSLRDRLHPGQGPAVGRESERHV